MWAADVDGTMDTTNEPSTPGMDALTRWQGGHELAFQSAQRRPAKRAMDEDEAVGNQHKYAKPPGTRLTVGFHNAGGGMNPLEFVTGDIETLNRKLKRFMTTTQGLADFLKCFGETDAAPGVQTWTTLFVDQEAYIKLKIKALEKVKVDVDSKDKHVKAMLAEEPAEYKNPRSKNDEGKEVFSPTIFNLVAVGDAAGDFDSENKMQKDDCDYRFNPFNRSTTTCGHKVDTNDARMDQADANDAKMDQADDNDAKVDPASPLFRKDVPQFHRAIGLIDVLGKDAAFRTLCRMASRRFARFKAAWDENPDKKGGDARGVLFYDLYTAYFLCYVLTNVDQKELTTHFNGYLGPGVCATAALFVEHCNVAGFAEFDKEKNRATKKPEELGTLVEYNENDEKLAIAIEPGPAQSMPYITGSVWTKNTAVNDMRGDLVEKIRAKEPFGPTALKEKKMSDEEKKAQKGIDEMSDEEKKAQKRIDKARKEIDKARKGIDKFLTKIVCAPVKSCTKGYTDETANIAVVHGKEFPEVSSEVTIVGAVNAIMQNVDVLMGDLNCTFKGSPRFFAAVLKKYRQMHGALKVDIDKLTDDDEERGTKTTTAEAFKSAIQFLTENASSAKLIEGETPPDFGDNIGIVPIASVTTDKTRGFTSIQPTKVNKHTSECKDFVFYDTQRWRYVNHNVYPREAESHAVDISKLNTGDWPYDHAAVLATFEPVAGRSALGHVEQAAPAACH